MQRMRVGVTGLAGVILVVAVATAIASGVRRSANETGPGAVPALAQDSKVASDNADAGRTEPLAKLGVAPVADGDQESTVPPDQRAR